MASTDIARGTLERHGLSDEQLRAMFRNMLLQRQLDNRGFQLNRQGKVPFALGSEGHEALQAGAAMAFNRGRDILAPYYRDLGLCLGSVFRRTRSCSRFSLVRQTTTAAGSSPTIIP